MNELTSKIAVLDDKDLSKIEEEILKLNCDLFLKTGATDTNSPELWRLSSEK